MKKIIKIKKSKKVALVPIEPISKYVLPKTWVSEKQFLKILQKTPAGHIYKRPAKGGGEWEYVTGAYIQKVLNYVFGWLWDFEVVQHGKEGTTIWVLGKLTVKNDQGQSITKTQFGRAEAKLKRDTNEYLDFGNDLKAATTDSLKKCASLLGIASDIYGKLEYKEIKEEKEEIVKQDKNTLTQKMIDSTSNIDTLIAIDTKIQASKEFTEEDKKKFHSTISSKVDDITNKQEESNANTTKK